MLYICIFLYHIYILNNQPKKRKPYHTAKYNMSNKNEKEARI